MSPWSAGAAVGAALGLPLYVFRTMFVAQDEGKYKLSPTQEDEQTREFELFTLNQPVIIGTGLAITVGTADAEADVSPWFAVLFANAANEGERGELLVEMSFDSINMEILRQWQDAEGNTVTSSIGGWPFVGDAFSVENTFTLTRRETKWAFSINGDRVPWLDIPAFRDPNTALTVEVGKGFQGPSVDVQVVHCTTPCIASECQRDGTDMCVIEDKVCEPYNCYTIHVGEDGANSCGHAIDILNRSVNSVCCEGLPSDVLSMDTISDGMWVQVLPGTEGAALAEKACNAAALQQNRAGEMFSAIFDAGRCAESSGDVVQVTGRSVEFVQVYSARYEASIALPPHALIPAPPLKYKLYEFTDLAAGIPVGLQFFPGIQKRISHVANGSMAEALGIGLDSFAVQIDADQFTVEKLNAKEADKADFSLLVANVFEDFAKTCADRTLSNGNEWKDWDGDKCEKYENRAWCFADGTPNEETWKGYARPKLKVWRSDYEIEEAARRNEISALDGCCVCGGGSATTTFPIYQEVVRPPLEEQCIPTPTTTQTTSPPPVDPKYCSDSDFECPSPWLLKENPDSLVCSVFTGCVTEDCCEKTCSLHSCPRFFYTPKATLRKACPDISCDYFEECCEVDGIENYLYMYDFPCEFCQNERSENEMLTFNITMIGIDAEKLEGETFIRQDIKDAVTTAVSIVTAPYVQKEDVHVKDNVDEPWIVQVVIGLHMGKRSAYSMAGTLIEKVEAGDLVGTLAEYLPDTSSVESSPVSISRGEIFLGKVTFKEHSPGTEPNIIPGSGAGSIILRWQEQMGGPLVFIPVVIILALAIISISWHIFFQASYEDQSAVPDVVEAEMEEFPKVSSHLSLTVDSGVTSGNVRAAAALATTLAVSGSERWDDISVGSAIVKSQVSSSAASSSKLSSSKASASTGNTLEAITKARVERYIPPPIEVQLLGAGAAYVYNKPESGAALKMYGEWNTNFFDCFMDGRILMCSCFCFPIFFAWRSGQNADRIGAMHTPLGKIDSGNAAIFSFLSVLSFALGLIILVAEILCLSNYNNLTGVFECTGTTVAQGLNGGLRIIVGLLFMLPMWYRAFILYKGVANRFRVDEGDIGFFFKNLLCPALSILHSARHIDSYYLLRGTSPPKLPIIGGTVFIRPDVVPKEERARPPAAIAHIASTRVVEI